MPVAGQPVFSPGPWGLLAREWQRTLRSENKSVNTVRIYLFAVRRFGDWAAARTPTVTPDTVRPRHIREFIAELIERTSPANAHTNYRALRTFFRWLESEEEIERSPMDRTKAPYVPDKPIPVISDAEVKAMIEACAGRDFASRRDTAILRRRSWNGILGNGSWNSARMTGYHWSYYKGQLHIGVVGYAANSGAGRRVV